MDMLDVFVLRIIMTCTKINQPDRAPQSYNPQVMIIFPPKRTPIIHDFSKISTVTAITDVTPPLGS